MTNNKKIIIFILVLFLILIFRKKQFLEKFFDEQYKHRNYISKDTLHGGNDMNIYIEFYYKDTCSVSKQFLYGCCKPFKSRS